MKFKSTEEPQTQHQQFFTVNSHNGVKNQYTNGLMDCTKAANALNNSSSLSHYIDQALYFMWEQHNITLFRNPNYGYGIAISGGQCSNSMESSPIYISDIVPGGPAENKLNIDDIILSVNGVNVEHVEHSFVIRLLKEAKEFIHLVIKRKLCNNNNANNTTLTSAQLTNTTTNNNNHNNSTLSNAYQQINPNELMSKRHNMAIQQTAATVMSNYCNQNVPSNSSDNGSNDQVTNGLVNGGCNGNDLMSNMMNSTSSMSSMKPFKLTLNRKDNKKEQFGIVLGCKYYIKDILPGSVAASMEPAGLVRKGDILLKLNDFTYEQMSLYQANKIIAKTKENKLNLLIKRVNHLNGGGQVINQCDDFDLLDCDQVDLVSNGVTVSNDNQLNEQQQTNMNELTSTKLENGKGNYENEHKELNKNEQTMANTGHQFKSPFKPLFKPLRQQQQQQQQQNEKKSTHTNGLPLNCRTAVFARENGIGIRLAGGNKVGIFICDVQYNSPAEKAGLKIADKIMKVNGVDYVQLTREEAVQHILGLQTIIEMIVVHSPEEYESFAFDPIGGDSFYVRAHFNYESKRPTDLSFKINDILHVTDTLYNGVIGQWVATKLPSMNEQLSEKVMNQDDLRGTIPNLANAEQFVQSAQTIDDKYNNAINASSSINLTSMKSTVASNALSLGASARMSLRKKLAGRGALNKRSKSASRSNGDLDTVANSNTQDINEIQVIKPNTFNSNKNQAYERVVLREVNFVRPVVLFGPLADVAREKLKSEAPGKYEIPDSYSTDPNEATQQQSSGVIKLATIKQIMERNRHCLLDITPNAVDHLNYAQYFPICIYLRSQSKSHTKELRQKYAKNLRAKSSRRLHENAMKLNDFYSHLFTCTVNLDSNQWFKQIKEIIDEQQNEPIWVSEDLERLLNEQADLVEQKMQALGNVNGKQMLDQMASTPNNYNSNQSHMIMKPSTMSTNATTHLNYFDDNFEFPIYTTANLPLSMSGAASSTYSLYEENNYNRSSFAASDSDICSSSAFKTGTNEPSTQIYSTNFNNNRNHHHHHHQHHQNNGTMILTGAVPVLLSSDNTSSPTVSTCSLKQTSNGVLHRVHSDPNLAVDQQDQLHQQQAPFNGKHQQANSSYTQYKQTAEGSQTTNDWKKYATYSAHSLKNMTKQHHQQQQQMMNDANNYVSNKSRISLNDSQFMAAQGEPRRMSTTSNDCSNASNGGTKLANLRNSASYSSYKLIKNSQSSLMPSHNKAVVDHPLLLASSTNADSNKNVAGSSYARNLSSSGSLLQPILNENELTSKMGDMHLLQNSNESPHVLKEKLKQELTSKLAEKSSDSIDARNANVYVNGLSSSSSPNQANLVLNSDVKAKRELFNNLSNQQRAPPTLPKPKFILPQTPTTNLVLQRNLKSKSELNIATTPNSFSASTSSSESSPSANKNSAQSGSTTTSNQKQQQQKQQQHQQQALRNKHLENSSTVSSSQGYHSDSWDSHSSRQSFDTDSQTTITTGNNNQSSNKFKNLLKATSKLASVSSSNTNSAQMNGKTSRSSLTKGQKVHIEHTTSVDPSCSSTSSPLILNQNILEKPTTSGSSSASSTLSTTSTHSNSSSTTQNSSSSQSSCVVAASDATTISSNSSNSFANHANGKNKRSSQANQNDAIELPIYYEPSNSHNEENTHKSSRNTTPMKSQMSLERSPNMDKSANNNSLMATSNNYSPFKEIYTSDSAKIRIMTYTAHYNDNGIYKKLSLDSNSNCSIIASANGIFDCNGGILESADTGVSLNVPEGAIAKGCSFDLYFKVCHCKSHITNGKGEPLTNPIVMCGPRGIKFLKPIELVIPHFITLDGQSWSYAFKTAEPNGSFSEDPYCWNVLRFHKKTLINSVTVLLDSF